MCSPVTKLTHVSNEMSKQLKVCVYSSFMVCPIVHVLRVNLSCVHVWTSAPAFRDFTLCCTQSLGYGLSLLDFWFWLWANMRRRPLHTLHQLYLMKSTCEDRYYQYTLITNEETHYQLFTLYIMSDSFFSLIVIGGL